MHVLLNRTRSELAFIQIQSRFQVNKIYEWVDILGKEYMNG
jgi:hypothetical protein